jgi:hypothetical protein
MGDGINYVGWFELRYSLIQDGNNTKLQLECYFMKWNICKQLCVEKLNSTILKENIIEFTGEKLTFLVKVLKVE